MKAAPDARLGSINLPREADQPYRINLIADNALAGAPLINAVVDPYRAEVVSLRDPRAFKLGDSMMAWQRTVHDGRASVRDLGVPRVLQRAHAAAVRGHGNGDVVAQEARTPARARAADRRTRRSSGGMNAFALNSEEFGSRGCEADTVENDRERSQPSRRSPACVCDPIARPGSLPSPSSTGFSLLPLFSPRRASTNRPTDRDRRQHLAGNRRERGSAAGDAEIRAAGRLHSAAHHGGNRARRRRRLHM